MQIRSCNTNYDVLSYNVSATENAHTRFKHNRVKRVINVGFCVRLAIEGMARESFIMTKEIRIFKKGKSD